MKQNFLIRIIFIRVLIIQLTLSLKILPLKIPLPSQPAARSPDVFDKDKHSSFLTINVHQTQLNKISHVPQ